MVTSRILLALLLLICGRFTAAASEARIIKVLPHYLDREGRRALSPSLYERDAYQDFLRKNPDQRSALRFDVQWKAKALPKAAWALRLELRTTKTRFGKPLVLEQPVQRHRGFSTWSAVVIQGKAFDELGDLIAWRATLRNGQVEVAELASFLW